MSVCSGQKISRMKQTAIIILCLATVSLAQRRHFREEENFRTVASSAAEKASSVEEERPPRPIAILRQNSIFNVDGQFKHDFVSENGITEETSGFIKTIDDGRTAQTMKGHYAYTAPDGTPIEASWWADETGFHMEARHVPTPPPMPEAIAQALEILPKLPVESDDSSSSASSSPDSQRRTDADVTSGRSIPKRFERRRV